LAIEGLFDTAGRGCFNCALILADRSQTLKDMINQTATASTRPQTPLRRLIALVLFLFVAYGATIEVVHKHGNPANSVDEASSSSISATNEGAAARDSRQSDTCLICQLHQNLFTALFNAQPGLVAPPAQTALRATAQPASYLSQMDTPRRGRAPPPASQL
jgi:hypothetical protein